MNHTLKLTLQRVEGAVIRTLGLIERRGFAVMAINTASDESSPLLELTLQISSAERSAETLARHVEKLFDVRTVDLVAAGSGSGKPKEE